MHTRDKEREADRHRQDTERQSEIEMGSRATNTVLSHPQILLRPS